MNQLTMNQIPINFETRSPINVERMTGQNARLYKWLSDGNTIHCFHPAKFQLQIGYLNSRCSDLVKAGVELFKRRITVKDINNENVDVVEYSIKPFNQ